MMEENINETPSMSELEKELLDEIEATKKEALALREESRKIVEGAPSHVAGVERKVHKDFLTAIDEINASSAFNHARLEELNNRFIECAGSLDKASLELQKALTILLVSTKRVRK